jgi:cyclopropane fatty-acyl-phospholipid synthase-like methyltransferase
VNRPPRSPHYRGGGPFVRRRGDRCNLGSAVGSHPISAPRLLEAGISAQDEGALGGSREIPALDAVFVLSWVAGIAAGLFAAYVLLHYVLYLLMAHPKDASALGLRLNEFEKRQLVEWTPGEADYLKHDNANRTYDDLFGTYRDENTNYSTCVFPRTPFTNHYEVETRLLGLKDGMRLLDLGCGSGVPAEDFAKRRKVDIVCVTNSTAQTEICRRKFAKFDGRLTVVTADFDKLDLPRESFDAIYAFESIGYTKNLDVWLARCLRMLKPGGRLLVRTPGGLDNCCRDDDYRSVSVFPENWHYNFLGANLLVHKMREAGFGTIRYRKVPFLAWGLTWNFLQLLWLWKFTLKMQTFVDLEKIIWRTSKAFVFGNGYNLVLASKPMAASVCAPPVAAASPSMAASSSPPVEERAAPVAASTSLAS